MRRLFTAFALVALPVSAACGGDAATTSVDAVSSTPVSSTPVSSAVPSSPISSAPPAPAALLVDSLPELTGPTVLWFWAPG